MKGMYRARLEVLSISAYANPSPSYTDPVELVATDDCVAT